LLPGRVADGFHQMAADEVLLEAAAAGVASLRFYTWQAPTLSLGYFQPAAVRLGDARLAGLPWVRRASGGSALVHHHEVTYALALPPGAPWQRRGTSWLHGMHAVIAAALANLGVRVSFCASEEKLDDVLCFLHHTPDDLRIGSAKVVGSAQRRQRGAQMQHGGILLAGSPFTPALPGIKELTGRDLSADEVASAVAAEFRRRTRWELVDAGWTPDDERRIAELAAGRYGNENWNGKR
jgi:lipoate-protein ligase A